MKEKNSVTKEKKDFYYSYDLIRTHQCLLNFILTNRGAGKTFGAKVIGIKDFIKTGEQFIYLRRYETEFKKKKIFFKDIIDSNMFPGHTFEVIGDYGYMDKQIICYFVALSTSLKEKSTPYPNVTKIFFDEFITMREKQKYLPEECHLMLEFASTVIRQRNNVSIFFLANKVSLVNPYFSYFKLKIDESKRFQKNKDKNIVVELFVDEEFVEDQKHNKFGQLIDGTTYGQYNLENESLQDNDCFVMPKLSNKKIFYCSFLYEGLDMGVWYVPDYKTYYIDNKVNNTSKKRYCVNNREHIEGYINIRFAKQDFKTRLLKKLYGRGLLLFSSNEIKVMFYEVVKYL